MVGNSGRSAIICSCRKSAAICFVARLFERFKLWFSILRFSIIYIQTWKGVVIDMTDINGNALISVKTSLVYEDDGADAIEMITHGQFCKDSDGYIIKYWETDFENSGNTKTTVTVEDNGLITVVREGDIHSHMVFEQGHKHLVHYDTEFGSLTVGISASKIRTTLGDDGGDIEINYAVEIDNTLASENRLKMNVKPDSLPS